MQKAAAKTATESRKFDHATPLLEELNWLRMTDCCCSVVPYFIKCLNGTGLTYLSDKLIPLTSTHNYRTRSVVNGHLAIPRACTNSKKRSFEYWAPALWNSLPLSIREKTNLTSFKMAVRATHM